MICNYQYYIIKYFPAPEKEDHPFLIAEHQVMQKLNEDPFFQYMFTIIIVGLLMKIATSIQFNEDIGPLIRIVLKMGNEFINFLIFYLILTLMFVMIGNIMFMYYC
jgi:hypothetical protein